MEASGGRGRQRRHPAALGTVFAEPFAMYNWTRGHPMGDEKPSGFTLRSNPRVRVTFDAPNQTECAGVVLLSELMRRIEWDEHLERHLPFQRARGMVGYPTQVLLKQIVIAIALGARRPEQIEIVREDDAPRVVSGDEATASSVTVWRHLKEYTAETYGRLRAFRTAITGE